MLTSEQIDQTCHNLSAEAIQTSRDYRFFMANAKRLRLSGQDDDCELSEAAECAAYMVDLANRIIAERSREAANVALRTAQAAQEG